MVAHHAIQKAQVRAHKEYNDNSGLGQLDGFSPVVYCGPPVFRLSLKVMSIHKSIWMDRGKPRKVCGCFGPQDKDDAVCGKIV